MAFMHESGQVFSASESFVENANVQDGMIYQNAQADRLGFWAEQAKQLHWITPWHTVLDWQRPNAKWFLGGQLNASANCLDVHINTHRRHKAALIWEGEQGDIRTVTYFQLYQEVSRLADALRLQFGIQKGDCVTIYMPM
ncbi:MAG: acetyl-coenzyme A synthetase N-terminal domain-containing protein, partial [Candidatus Margulisiibacteriota bacterium]